MKNNCTVYPGLVENIQDIIKNIKEADDLNLVYGTKLSSYKIKEWTKQDYINFATGPSTRSIFNSFIVLIDAADETMDGKKSNNYTPDALCARAALNAIKPKCCPDLDAYCKMIDQVASETLEKRKLLKANYPDGIPLRYKFEYIQDNWEKGLKPQYQGNGRGQIINLYKFSDIAGEPQFDEQGALDRLAQNNVTLDSEHSLKAPLQTAVTDAIKGMKSSITLAA